MDATIAGKAAAVAFHSIRSCCRSAEESRGNSDSRCSALATTPSSSIRKWPSIRRMVIESKRSVAYSKVAVTTPSSSSAIARVRSNFAAPVFRRWRQERYCPEAVAFGPKDFQGEFPWGKFHWGELPGRFSSANITWKSGAWLRWRSGASLATSISKGRS